MRFLALSSACLQGLARTHRRPAKLPQRRALIHEGCGLAHKRKVQTCVVIAIVDGSGGCHAVLVCV